MFVCGRLRRVRRNTSSRGSILSKLAGTRVSESRDSPGIVTADYYIPGTNTADYYSPDTDTTYYDSPGTVTADHESRGRNTAY